MLTKLRYIKCFFKDIYSNKQLILNLALNDFKIRYAGSYLGIIWGFIQPLINLLVMWFVFQVGFKSKPVEDFPFILWLICGMIPWTFFSDALTNATNSLIEYNYLVKKIVFRVSILPIVKIISSLFVHLFFIGFIFAMFIIYGYTVNIYWIQSLYYSFCLISFVLAISWFTSALIVFVKDVGQVVSVVLQFGFWLTPIFWSHEILPDKYAALFKLNPIYYVVEGYRDSFINGVWFWERYNQTLYFWVVTIVILILGILFFKKLRPHFSDML